MLVSTLVRPGSVTGRTYVLGELLFLPDLKTHRGWLVGQGVRGLDVGAGEAKLATGQTCAICD
jgi:hypothetical protein